MITLKSLLISAPRAFILHRHAVGGLTSGDDRRGQPVGWHVAPEGCPVQLGAASIHRLFPGEGLVGSNAKLGGLGVQPGYIGYRCPGTGVTLAPTVTGGGWMPWLETNPVLERRHFIHDFDSGQWTMTELCLRYGISRNTGHKWLNRYRQSGASGLHDHSRAPRSCPHQTPDELVEWILEENSRYGWGARKVLKRLQKRYPHRAWLARSTVFDILQRHGRVRSRQRHRRWKHPGAAPPHPTRFGPSTSKGSSSCATGSTATR
ncbi:MAG: helix-turn-helix domain-containing protein [Acidobacteriota bacterium]